MKPTPIVSFLIWESVYKKLHHSLKISMENLNQYMVFSADTTNIGRNTVDAIHSECIERTVHNA